MSRASLLDYPGEQEHKRRLFSTLVCLLVTLVIILSSSQTADAFLQPISSETTRIFTRNGYGQAFVSATVQSSTTTAGRRFSLLHPSSSSPSCRRTKSPMHVCYAKRTRTKETMSTLYDTTTTTTTDSAGNEMEHQQSQVQQPAEEEKWVDESKTIELILLGIWGVSISAFILVNNFIGPWPSSLMKSIPERVYFLLHMYGGMFFGGGIILTTCIEWLVTQTRNKSVLQFWFDKVPLLDAVIVVPALTVSMISGTGLSVQRYGSLANAPVHVVAVFYALVAFCAWWAFTDLTTQGSALVAVNEHMTYEGENNDKKNKNVVPKVVTDRVVSNVVSCMFVMLLYFIMVMKPGTLIWRMH